MAPEDMPVDAHGNRADIIMSGAATVSRMNYGRLYEHYFNAASRDLMREIHLTLGVSPEDRDLYKKVTRVENENPELFERVWQRYLGFIEIMSPRQYDMYIDGRIKKSKAETLTKSIREKHIDIFYPTDNQPEPTNQVRLIEQFYPPLDGPVRYRGNSGAEVITTDNVMIGAVYIMLLEKVGDDWSATSSAKFQHFGVLAQVSMNDKYSRPVRNNSVRGMGESEVRIYAAYCGSHVTADLIDRYNNVNTHRHMCAQILNTDKPTAIYSIVDRSQMPLGGAKPLQLIKHIVRCAGAEFVMEQPTESYNPPTSHNPALAVA